MFVLLCLQILPFLLFFFLFLLIFLFCSFLLFLVLFFSSSTFSCYLSISSVIPPCLFCPIFPFPSPAVCVSVYFLVLPFLFVYLFTHHFCPLALPLFSSTLCVLFLSVCLHVGTPAYIHPITFIVLLCVCMPSPFLFSFILLSPAMSVFPSVVVAYNSSTCFSRLSVCKSVRPLQPHSTVCLPVSCGCFRLSTLLLSPVCLQGRTSTSIHHLSFNGMPLCEADANLCVAEHGSRFSEQWHSAHTARPTLA